MPLNYKKLRDALLRMNRDDGLTWAEIGKLAGVSASSVMRIATGITKTPAYETWSRLHGAFAYDVPPPEDRVEPREDFFSKFADPKIAERYCRKMLELERLSPRLFRSIDVYLDSLLDTIAAMQAETDQPNAALRNDLPDKMPGK